MLAVKSPPISKALDTLSRLESEHYQKRQKRRLLNVLETLSKNGFGGDKDEFGRTCRLAVSDCKTAVTDEDQSSDEETDTDYCKDIADFSTAVSEIMEEVSQEFSDVSEIINSPIGELKKKYPKEYKELYMPLSLVEILKPFVRLEILQWYPMSSEN
eukprot:GHVL01011393.1.p1 GENE.GHVL01011393.1~~GHVL01011393.1.p1  ORF type:complete len:157 (+),score=40.74 GHVL01011393.1:245-715(+)